MATAGAGDAVRGRLLLGALRVVERALALAAGEAADSPVDCGAEPLNADKVRCEAAMLLRAAARVADRDPGLPTAVSRLADSLGADGNEAMSVRLCLHPGIALDLALVPLHLRALGRGDPHLEPLLEDLFGAERLRGPERPPHRELEQLWLHDLWTGTVSPDLPRVLSASSLAHDFDHLSGTTEDAYAFTHTILYASDHGRRRVELPRSADQVVAGANAILAVALDAGNHDVAAEVLWTWPMLNLPMTPLAREARALLAEVCGRWGFLPGPGFDAAAHGRLPSPQREAYELRTSYHTTLVHGLLAAAELGGADAGRPGPVMAGTRGAAGAIAAFVQPGVRAAAWWARVASLPPARRDALAPALVTMALRRAAGIPDLAAVREILDLSAAHRLPETPATVQARALLRRAISYAELAGARA